MPAAFALEAASYPADEAADLAGLTFRQRVAPEYFYGAFARGTGELVGFVVGTCCAGDELREETMSAHDPAGETLCIHSVVVAEPHRRKGLASAMLTAYCERLVDEGESPIRIVRIALIAKKYLVGFYKQCGFMLVGLSAVVHGRDPWFELQMDLQLRRAAKS